MAGRYRNNSSSVYSRASFSFSDLNPFRISFTSGASDRMAMVSFRLSNSPGLISTAAGAPFFVMTISSSVSVTACTSPLSFILASERDSVFMARPPLWLTRIKTITAGRRCQSETSGCLVTLPHRGQDDVENHLLLPAAQVELGRERLVAVRECLDVDVQRTPRVFSGNVGGVSVVPIRVGFHASPMGVVIPAGGIGMPPLDTAPGKGPAIGGPQQPARNDQPLSRGRPLRCAGLVERSLAVRPGGLAPWFRPGFASTDKERRDGEAE